MTTVARTSVSRTFPDFHAPDTQAWDAFRRASTSAAAPHLRLPLAVPCRVAPLSWHNEAVRLVCVGPIVERVLALAPAAGVVVRAGFLNKWGNGVVLRLPDGHDVVIAGLAADIWVRIGEPLWPGQPLGVLAAAELVVQMQRSGPKFGRALAFRFAGHAALGNGGPRWMAGLAPGRAILQALPTAPSDLRSIADLAPRPMRFRWSHGGQHAARFLGTNDAQETLFALPHGQGLGDGAGELLGHQSDAGWEATALTAAAGPLLRALRLGIPAAPFANTDGLWWRRELRDIGGWRARLLPSWRVRALSGLVHAPAGRVMLRTRLQTEQPDLPQSLLLSIVTTDPTLLPGLLDITIGFADGWLRAERDMAAVQSADQGMMQSAGQTDAQRAALAA